MTDAVQVPDSWQSNESGYLDRDIAPVVDEIEVYDLPVTGSLPPELNGRYLRNGGNPLHTEDPSRWFGGHGMVHGVRIDRGRAVWYRNRWVRTKWLAGAPRYRADGSRDRAVHSANTHVIGHGGRILALNEAGFPYELSPDLATVGPCDFGGRLTTAMTAHPTLDPITGELHMFGYAVESPYLTYHRLSPTGELLDSVIVDVPAPTMMHDFAVTEHYVVWLDLPLTYRRPSTGRTVPFQWDDDYGARIGLMRRDRPGAVVWFEIEPCYVFHIGNAHEDASGRVIIDAVRYDGSSFRRIWSSLPGSNGIDDHHGLTGQASAVLHQWVIDPDAATVTEEQLDDRSVEFPTLDAARVGRSNRYLYAVTGYLRDNGTIVKYDIGSGSVGVHELPLGQHAGEAVFVPRHGARDEDDGWLMTIVSSSRENTSELAVFDARSMRSRPIASIRLPRRVPRGFHGSWIPDC